MASNADYRGYYIGVDRSGIVRTVYERKTRDGIELSLTGLNGFTRTELVQAGREARSEVFTLFEVMDAQYVPASLIGGESEKRAIERANAKAAEVEKPD